MKRLSPNQRRATILLMVVSLLALLFVIVTGFLNLARNFRENVTQSRKGDEINRVIASVTDLAISQVGFKRGTAINAGQPNLVMGGNNRDYPYADIPGYGTTPWLASSAPVWDGTRVGTNPPNIAPPNTPSYILANGTNQVDLWQLRYPAVTVLEPVSDTTQPDPRNRRPKPISPPVIALFPEDANDRDSVFNASKGQGNASNPSGFSSGFEMSRQAANGYMDATGAGVPDSHLLASGMANEVAAAIAGVNLNLPRIDYTLPLNTANVPAQPNSNTAISTMPQDPNNPNTQVVVGFQEAMKRFYDSSPYVVSVRIISHGGMVTLDSPQLVNKTNGSISNQPLPWNRRFTTDLFNAIRSPNDNYYVPRVNDPNWNTYLTALSKDSAAVEGDLRRRGGVLANYREFSNLGNLAQWSTTPREPSALQQLEAAFPNTFLPAFRTGVGGQAFARKKDNYQRFNMGITGYSGGSSTQDPLNDRAAFSNGVAINPYNYLTDAGALNNTRATFIGRSQIANVNNSDDLARKQEPSEPKYSDPNGASETAALMSNPGTYRGATKFWLGELQNAFIQDPARPGNWAVDSRGISGTSLDPVAGTAMPKSRSDLVVEKLAGYFYDMLASNDDPAGPLPPPFTLDLSSVAAQWDTMSNPTPPAGKEVISRAEQAWMMAVNALAWAAPRDPLTSPTPGFVDAVVYPSQVYPATVKKPRFVGYGPQPFISEAICYDADPSGTHTSPAIAFAVEIYNPCDPSADPAGAADVFGLYLPGFAVSVSADTDSNYVFGPAPIVTTAAAQRMSGRTFRTVVLQDGSNNGWPAIADPNTMHVLTSPTKFPTASKYIVTIWRAKRQPLTTNVKEWLPIDRIQFDAPTNASLDPLGDWTAAHRDTSPNPFFGAMGATLSRWSIATEMGLISGGPGAPIETSLNNANFLDNGNTARTPVVVAPITPFPTMSAGVLSDLRLFATNGVAGGALPRPRSYPTVGFMMFLPRFSHSLLFEGGSLVPRTMSDFLHREWVSKSYNPDRLNGYPLDFGHMPLFDNTFKIALTSPTVTPPNPQPASIPAASFMQTTGPIPWGQLVFDYFTVINPNMDLNGDGAPDIDPLKIPGRININTAAWQVLENIPLIGPMSLAPGNLPLRVNNSAVLTGVLGQDPSPSFWMAACGVLTGTNADPNVPGGVNYRFMGTYPSGSFPGPSTGGPPHGVSFPDGLWSMGPWLAWSTASYRDGIQYVPNTATQGGQYYRDSNLRGFVLPTAGLNSGLYVGYRPHLNLNQYGQPPGPNLVNGASVDHGIRGQAIFDPSNPVIPTGPREFGYVTLGELLNAKGWDSSSALDLTPGTNELADPTRTTVGKGDFVKAVSLVALLDTAFLTTRSNTFTVYTSVIDRNKPENSLRSQVTLDRSNMLPRLVTTGQLFTVGPTPVTITTSHQTIEGAASPAILQERTVGYFNARYDD